MADFFEDDPAPRTLTGDPVVEEARRRCDQAIEWEADWRQKFMEDIKFENGDSDNGYQWPNAIRRTRDTEARPCLTINVLQQHNFQITNRMRMNKSSVSVMATGGRASVESAKIMKSLIRHTEYISNAQAGAYRIGREFQVGGGIGWWRIITKYASDDTFDQEVYICEVEDPLAVYGDPDCSSDGLDRKWLIYFDDVPKDKFGEAYPRWKGKGDQAPLGIGSVYESWVNDRSIRVAEYFRVVQKEDVLISFVDPQSGLRKTIRKSMVKKALRNRFREILERPETLTRPIFPETVEWYLIVGQEIVDTTIWPGPYIPFISCIGKETRIEGKMDRKGHTRAMKDAQRMYNYNASAQVEFTALQGKTPWLAPLKAIEELETYWATANTKNHSVLPYNHLDEEFPDKPIPPPQRQEPPNAAPAYQSGMDTAFNQMMMASGQWQNQMGMQGNERTGVAIQERQDQGDTATYHFEDNYASALRTTGKQLLVLYPLVYDSERVIHIQDEDGMQSELQVDPGAKQALQLIMSAQGEVLHRIFNPTIGQYDIMADVGKDYGSRRREAVEVLKLVLTQNPGLTGLVGDLLLKNIDIDEAQEGALRLKRMVPPQALGIGPTANEQKLQQQVQALTQMLGKALQKAGKDTIKLAGKDQMRDIDVYKAETDRMKALADMLGLDEAGVRSVVQQLVEDAMSTRLDPIIEANKKGLSEETDDEGGAAALQIPPAPGARQAPDGQWYVLDPTRRGKYLRIAPLAQEKAPSNVIANG